MKDKLLILTIISILGLLASMGSVHATANTVGNNWTVTGGENCTITVLSTAQKTSIPVPETKFLWNVTLKVNNTGGTAKTCEVYYTGYKNIYNDAVVYNSTGSAIATVTTGSDGDSRRYWNFSSESVPATTAKYESIVFNFTVSAITQDDLTQRLVDQKLVNITNNAEVTVTNLNSSSVTYDRNWGAGTIRIWDCGATDYKCNDAIGSGGSKSEITTLTNDTTNKYIYFTETSLPTGSRYYSVEGQASTQGGEYYEYGECDKTAECQKMLCPDGRTRAVACVNGVCQYASCAVVVGTPTYWNPTQGTNPLIWVLIIFIIIVVVAIIVKYH